ncbi:hypothetical protein [Oceanospirillum beijerinckii]|uniref:hypothetical protein n=1 Tax=Oceanospirillum beijerinckii TaxID=64976 RepID=UPI00056D6608|nr:hypothetical protein [Oceanospirillum beijerinckii]
MLQSTSQSAAIPSTNQQLPVGLSGEIISRSQIGQEFVWPKNDPRSQWQAQRTYEASDDSRIRHLSVSPHFDMAMLLENPLSHDLPVDEYQWWYICMGYKLNSRLLPYHGIAVLMQDDKDGTERMVIRHEISVIGNQSFTRVVNEKGLTQFYEPSKL